MWLIQNGLFYVDSLKLKGYMRKVLRTNMVGFQVKNVTTICHFNFILYQNKEHCHDILVEIRHGIGKRIDNAIDPKWMRMLLKGTEFEGHFKEIEGRSFLVGESLISVPSQRPSILTAQCSYGFRLLNLHGNILATALAFKDKVGGFDDAVRLDKLLNRVRMYVLAMSPNGNYETEKKLLTSKIGSTLEDIDALDRELSSQHEMYREGIETLKKYGIEYKD